MDEKITSRENAKIKYACRLASGAAFRRTRGVFWPKGANCARSLPGAQSWRPCFIPKMRWKSARSLPLCRASTIW